MFYIVETEEQLLRLTEQCQVGCYIDLVTTNDNYHPKLSGLVAVYVQPFLLEEESLFVKTSDKGYIIPVCHDEGLSVSRDRIEELLSEVPEIYVQNKKRVLYHFPGQSNRLKDLSLKYSMITYSQLNTSVKNTTYNWYYNRYGGEACINQIIPLPKLYEKCEETYRQIVDEFKKLGQHGIFISEPSGYDFYNNQATTAFFLVEQNGIRVDVHSFEEKFKPQNIDFSIQGETVYTEYNLYNSTSRPTNSCNSVNFLAIPKGKEYRRCFKPSEQGGSFVEFDHDGYHLRLVSEQIGYKLSTEEKAHTQLAKLYYSKDNISEEDYRKAKLLNFQMIYGNIPPEYSFLEFTEKLQAYIDSIWKGWKEQGKVYNPISRKCFDTNLGEMYPQKLMNYVVQSLETSRNVLTLCKVLGFLARGNYKSKIALVVYDAFILDIAPGEEGIVDQIKNIMEGQTENKVYGTATFPVNVCISKDFNF